MAFSSQDFRAAMGRFATGICVVTCPATGARAPMAITVNSFASVSLDPPLVLWCLDKGSDRCAAFAEAEAYGVTVLADDQEALSVTFAERGGIGDVPHEIWETGAPILTGGLAAFDTRVAQRIDAGDHLILVGHVVRLAASQTKTAPLLYFGGDYGALSS